VSDVEMQRADWLAVTASAWSPLRAHSPSTIINGDQEDDIAANPFIVLLKRNVLCFTGDDVSALAGLCGLVVEIAMWKRYVRQFPYCSYSPPLSPLCQYHTSTFFTLSDYILSFVIPHDSPLLSTFARRSTASHLFWPKSPPLLFLHQLFLYPYALLILHHIRNIQQHDTKLTVDQIFPCRSPHHVCPPCSIHACR
jgi:hypothetical protein